MRNFFAALLILIPSIPSSISAQTDVSIWSRRADNKFVLMPWIVDSSSTIVIDVRYNFDASKTITGFVGKNVRIGSVTLTPALGFMGGEYEAVSVESYLNASFGKISLFLMDQYSKGFGDHYNFTYHWGDLWYYFSSRVQGGMGAQTYWDTLDKEFFVDLGPTIRVVLGKMYFRFWPTFSPVEDQGAKVFLIAGFSGKMW
jgi:hypothetical protein